jgi:hypothetical protein
MIDGLWPRAGNTKGGSITVLLISCLTGLENRLIQTYQTGGQWYSDTSPFIIPCLGSMMCSLQLPKSYLQLQFMNIGNKLDTQQHNDTEHNDTQHNEHICKTKHNGRICDTQ